MIAAMQSSRGCSFHSLTIPKLLEVDGNGCIKLLGFAGLISQSRSKPFHLLFERLPIVFNLQGTDIPTWRERVTVLTDVFQRRSFAETGHVGIGPGILVTAPSMISSSNRRHVAIAKFPVYSVN